MHLLGVLACPLLVLILLKNRMVDDVGRVVVYLMNALWLQIDGRWIGDASHSYVLLELFNLSLEDCHFGAS